MPLTSDDWSTLLGGLGATHVVRADGSPIEYATRVRLVSATSDPTPSDVQVVLLNETGQELGRVRGDQLVGLVRGAANTLTVVDEIEVDGTPTTKTRGASAPSSDPVTGPAPASTTAKPDDPKIK